MPIRTNYPRQLLTEQWFYRTLSYQGTMAVGLSRKGGTGEKAKVSEERLLNISLLGSPEVSFEGGPLRFGTKKALALLCYLSAEGKKYPRWELAELLWPKSDRRSARTDLRSTLSRLRKALGENGARGVGSSERVSLLDVDGDFLGVEPEGIKLDLRKLEAAVSLARSETSEPSAGGRSVNGAVERRDLLTYLEEALVVYRGEFMEGFSLEDAPEFELWLEAERVRWRSMFGELCDRVSRLQAEAGRLKEAIGTARLWVGHGPLEEDAQRGLIELLSSGGNSEGALRAYEDYRSVLSRELGSEPSMQLMELAERLQEEIEERASLRLSLGHTGNTDASALSVLEVPFVGRHEEFSTLVSEYETCLSGEEPRVVAVIGEAGIGKTRLCEEFLGWARARGTDVLRGEASKGAGWPYGPLVEAIRPRMERERAPEDLLEDVWLTELSRLLPELKERYPDLPSPTSGEGETAKVALFEGIARMVAALASHAPVVLFQDDLQWADSATLEVLMYAGKRWAEQGVPVLLLTAVRSEEAEGSSGFGGWLSSIRRVLPARNLNIGPLENEYVEKLLQRLSRVDLKPLKAEEGLEGADQPRNELQRVGRWLSEESGRQPFYFIEALKSLLEEGKLVIREHPDRGAFWRLAPP